jgi:hypothetical protein
LGSLDLVKYERDFVHVDASSSPWLVAETSKWDLTYFEFQRLLARKPDRDDELPPAEIESPDFWVEYHRNGIPVRLSRAQNPDDDAFHSPWLLSKLFAFRAVQLDGKSVCRW